MANPILEGWSPRRILLATKVQGYFETGTQSGQVTEGSYNKAILVISVNGYKRLKDFIRFVENKKNVAFEIRRYSFGLQSGCRPTDRL